MWVKAPHSWCKLGTGWGISLESSLHTMMVNGMPIYIKDLHPCVSLDTSASDTSSECSESDRIVTIRGRASTSSDVHDVVKPEDSSRDESFEHTTQSTPVIISFQRSSRLKRPVLMCHLCDGECNKRENPLPQKKVSALCVVCPKKLLAKTCHFKYQKNYANVLSSLTGMANQKNCSENLF